MCAHTVANQFLVGASTDWWTAGPTIALAAIAFAAALVAACALFVANRDARVDRTIALHRDMTTGETQAARRRLGATLWHRGAQESQRPNVCCTPAWADFLPGVPGGSDAGWLVTYPSDVVVTGDDVKRLRPLDDLYLLLSGFERLSEAFDAGTLHKKLVRELFAWDVCWWCTCLRNIEYSPETGEGDTPRIRTLRRLAE